jgi:integrase
MTKHNALTVKAIEALTAPGRHADGGNLYLSISPSGTRAWTFIYRIDGRTREAGLGKYPNVGLKEARGRAAEGRTMLNAKPRVDPLTVWRNEKTAKGVPTFREAAEDYVAAHEGNWRSEIHRQQWRTTLSLDPSKTRRPGREFCKALLEIRVDAIDVNHVLAVLRPLWKRVPETASRVRNRIELVLAASQALGHIGADRANPARWRGHLDKLLPGRKEIDRGHHEALPYAEGPAFMAALRARRCDEDGAIDLPVYALEFAILTATRTGEALGARWQEFELEAKGGPVWRIPKERMKSGRGFEVPLSGGAVAILNAMLAIRTDDLVFSRGEPNARLGRQAFIRVLQRMRVSATAHGIARSTFRDWAGDETSFPRDVCEMALGHKVGDKTEAAYRRQDALEKRRALMAQWDDFLASDPAGNVIPLAGARA